MKIRTAVLLVLVASLPSNLFAFCGFFVGKADTSLYNKSSKVILTHHENRNVLSMMNDYDGDLTEFALVVPVPEILKEGQIHIGERKIFEHIDAFSAPRLVEYFDSDPCSPVPRMEMLAMSDAGSGAGASRRLKKSYGVQVEAEYTIGEYDIVILSAKESEGLEDWLIDNQYNIPRGAREALRPYILQGMKFFVAKVNLKEKERTGLNYLRPLQIAFSSEKFMLPIRLGLINANGPQELMVFLITKQGRVETTNYRTQKIPSDVDVPIYIKEEFGAFYKAMFDEQVRRAGMSTVFLEYFWNMGWCDPCAADPLSTEELRELGVFWLGDISQRSPLIGGGLPVMLTRLHVRYTGETFPEDLMFQETKDNQNFQGRYIMRHPWKGEATCDQARQYFENKRKSQEQEAQNLASLTGWDINQIRSKMEFVKASLGSSNSGEWWKGIWK